MDREALVEKLKSLIGDFLKSRNIDLVDLVYRYEGRNLVLRILVERPEGGINLDECAVLNQDISNILDGEGSLEARYILEVSSPGLDRPLTTRSDFLRCTNRKAKFFLNEKVNGKLEWDGIISRVEGDLVYIDAEGMVLEIPLARIVKAKQLI